MTLSVAVSEAVEQRERGFDAVDRFMIDAGDSPSTWVVAPLLRALYLQIAPSPVSRRLAGGRVWLERAGNHAYAVAKPSDARYLRVGPALVTYAGDTQGWALEPVIEWAAEQGVQRSEIRARASRRSLAAANREAIDRANEFVDFIVTEEIAAPCPLPWVYRHFLGAARYLAHARALLAGWSGGPIAVGTHHSKAARALLHEAHRAGIATVYFPHAALLRDRRFWDVPTHYGGVRGSGDLEIYRRLGVDEEAITVTGDPGLDVPDHCELDLNGRVAFGLPPISGTQMTETIATVYDAVGDHIVVTPHPDHTPEMIRDLLPEAWTISRVRTYEHLKTGVAPLLIQNSSGVALESMLLGVPPIQLEIEGWEPNYFAIDRDHIRFARGAVELAAAVDEARRVAADSERRRQLVDWGRVWCDSDGATAAARSWSLIERATEAGPRDSVAWDAWAPSELAPAEPS